MKSLVYVLVSFFLLTSCVKYEQAPLLSLSGEYRVDKITYEEVDNTASSNNMVFYPGDLYVNPSEVFPMDSIQVGFTRISMDYSMIRFNPINNADGSVNWTKEYTYYVHGQTTQYDLGRQNHIRIFFCFFLSNIRNDSSNQCFYILLNNIKYDFYK